MNSTTTWLLWGLRRLWSCIVTLEGGVLASRQCPLRVLLSIMLGLSLPPWLGNMWSSCTRDGLFYEYLSMCMANNKQWKLTLLWSSVCHVNHRDLGLWGQPQTVADSSHIHVFYNIIVLLDYVIFDIARWDLFPALESRCTPHIHNNILRVCEMSKLNPLYVGQLAKYNIVCYIIQALLK